MEDPSDVGTLVPANIPFKVLAASPKSRQNPDKEYRNGAPLPASTEYE